MESSRQLDPISGASARRPSAVALILLISAAYLPWPGLAQTPQTELTSRIKTLFDQQRWAEILDEVKQPSAEDAELNYFYGGAAAQLGHWDEAHAAFLAGQRLRPNDERFPIELGGVAFRQKRYSEAARWLRRGLQLKPDDSYANEFLATIYFLNGNLEAALKYWNRIGKPEIENVRTGPELRVDPALLDRAFAFAPASVLSLPDFLTTAERVDGLGIFPVRSFQLAARTDGRFDVLFLAQERNGWGNDKWEALLSTFRGIFYETIHPEYFNIERSAINLTSLVRWDSQKRRLRASLSGPLGHNPKYRVRVGTDLRNENWDLGEPFPAPAPLLGAFNLRREAVEGEVTSFSSGRWSWSTGAEFSHRDYRNVLAGSALPQDVLLEGYQLKHFARLNYQLWRIPERRFAGRASLSSQTGTIWSGPAHSFEKLQAAVAAHWFPRMTGDDYATEWQVRLGRTFGQVPFDELFMLSLERDNDLWMRAHVGTRDGRKGSAPLGRNYVLMNWAVDKNIFDNGFLNIKLGPFLDAGKSTDPAPGLGSGQWLWDTGLQAKFRVLGVGFMIVYGKDLRSGKNAFYVAGVR
jgi:tetratricopeptide (TPR) repeat protein